MNVTLTQLKQQLLLAALTQFQTETCATVVDAYKCAHTQSANGRAGFARHAAGHHRVVRVQRLHIDVPYGCMLTCLPGSFCACPCEVVRQLVHAFLLATLRAVMRVRVPACVRVRACLLHHQAFSFCMHQ